MLTKIVFAMIIVNLFKSGNLSGKYHGNLESWASESDTSAFKSIVF